MTVEEMNTQLQMQVNALNASLNSLQQSFDAQTALITQPVNIAGTVCTADNDFVDRTAGIYPNIMTAPTEQSVNARPFQSHIAVA